MRSSGIALSVAGPAFVFSLIVSLAWYTASCIVRWSWRRKWKRLIPSEEEEDEVKGEGKADVPLEMRQTMFRLLPESQYSILRVGDGCILLETESGRRTRIVAQDLLSFENGKLVSEDTVSYVLTLEGEEGSEKQLEFTVTKSEASSLSSQLDSLRSKTSSSNVFFPPNFESVCSVRVNLRSSDCIGTPGLVLNGSEHFDADSILSVEVEEPGEEDSDTEQLSSIRIELDDECHPIIKDGTDAGSSGSSIELALSSEDADAFVSLIDELLNQSSESSAADVGEEEKHEPTGSPRKRPSVLICCVAIDVMVGACFVLACIFLLSSGIGAGINFAQNGNGNGDDGGEDDWPDIVGINVNTIALTINSPIEYFGLLVTNVNDVGLRSVQYSALMEFEAMRHQPDEPSWMSASSAQEVGRVFERDQQRCIIEWSLREFLGSSDDEEQVTIVKSNDCLQETDEAAQGTFEVEAVVSPNAVNFTILMRLVLPDYDDGVGFEKVIETETIPVRAVSSAVDAHFFQWDSAGVAIDSSLPLSCVDNGESGTITFDVEQPGISVDSVVALSQPCYFNETEVFVLNITEVLICCTQFAYVPSDPTVLFDNWDISGMALVDSTLVQRRSIGSILSNYLSTVPTKISIGAGSGISGLSLDWDYLFDPEIDFEMVRRDGEIQILRSRFEGSLRVIASLEWTQSSSTSIDFSDSFFTFYFPTMCIPAWPIPCLPVTPYFSIGAGVSLSFKDPNERHVVSLGYDSTVQLEAAWSESAGITGTANLDSAGTITHDHDVLGCSESTISVSLSASFGVGLGVRWLVKSVPGLPKISAGLALTGTLTKDKTVTATVGDCLCPEWTEGESIPPTCQVPRLIDTSLDASATAELANLKRRSWAIYSWPLQTGIGLGDLLCAEVDQSCREGFRTECSAYESCDVDTEICCNVQFLMNANQGTTRKKCAPIWPESADNVTDYQCCTTINRMGYSPMWACPSDWECCRADSFLFSHNQPFILGCCPNWRQCGGPESSNGCCPAGMVGCDGECFTEAEYPLSGKCCSRAESGALVPWTCPNSDDMCCGVGECCAEYCCEGVCVDAAGFGKCGNYDDTQRLPADSTSQQLCPQEFDHPCGDECCGELQQCCDNVCCPDDVLCCDGVCCSDPTDKCCNTDPPMCCGGDERCYGGMCCVDTSCGTYDGFYSDTSDNCDPNLDDRVGDRFPDPDVSEPAKVCAASNTELCGIGPADSFRWDALVCVEPGARVKPFFCADPLTLAIHLCDNSLGEGCCGTSCSTSGCCDDTGDGFFDSVCPNAFGLEDLNRRVVFVYPDFYAWTGLNPATVIPDTGSYGQTHVAAARILRTRAASIFGTFKVVRWGHSFAEFVGTPEAAETWVSSFATAEADPTWTSADFVNVVDAIDAFNATDVVVFAFDAAQGPHSAFQLGLALVSAFFPPDTEPPFVVHSVFSDNDPSMVYSQNAEAGARLDGVTELVWLTGGSFTSVKSFAPVRFWTNPGRRCSGRSWWVTG